LLDFGDAFAVQILDPQIDRPDAADQARDAGEVAVRRLPSSTQGAARRRRSGNPIRSHFQPG
jgi:hypothetical protein